MKPVIEVSNLSKKFVISHQGAAKPNSFRESITSGAQSLFKRSSNESVSETKEDFWALNDLNFKIMPGERVAILGRNGSGKSTLLKVISRITEPTKGRIVLRGRVASLLEVGTGFHQELSGRENIYLNGAILGMSRQEIRSKFDEIVAFSEVEQFLDTPVKRYSSGMYVRLAFAVAAHLEPEILIVDEVLAVGDAEFQKKSLGKLSEVSNEDGRTVLFVSHQIAAVKALCEKGILLSHGSLQSEGPIGEVIEKYSALQESQDQTNFLSARFRSEPCIRVNRIMVNGLTTNPLKVSGDKTTFEIEIDFSLSTHEKVNFEMTISDTLGQPLAFLSPGHYYGNSKLYPPGRHTLQVKFSFPVGINKGTYHGDFMLAATDLAVHFYAPKMFVFEAEGFPSKTGGILEYKNGRGWIFLDSLSTD